MNGVQVVVRSKFLASQLNNVLAHAIDPSRWTRCAVLRIVQLFSDGMPHRRDRVPKRKDSFCSCCNFIRALTWDHGNFYRHDHWSLIFTEQSRAIFTPSCVALVQRFLVLFILDIPDKTTSPALRASFLALCVHSRADRIFMYNVLVGWQCSSSTCPEKSCPGKKRDT